MSTTSPKSEKRKRGKADGWRRPARRRVVAIRERLRQMYGVPVNKPNRRPIDELVLTILSQHTNDRNSGRAFKALKEAFPSWDEVRDAPVGEVEDAIRPGGLAQQKAPRIQTILRELGPEPSLDWTETAPLEESRAYLLSLNGVGRKTAACVLLFSWGLPDIPVDVHIHRVGGRLGLFPEKASLERSHDEMLALVPSSDVYEFHLNLIRHGRTICRPKPRCGECELRRMCPWYRDLDPRESVVGG
jgi:endonuclease III